MHKIIKITEFAENVREYEIEGEKILRNARPGQFVIIITDEDGERLPFTIVKTDREKGSVTVLVQTVGYSTMLLANKREGDYIHSFVGPLGFPTELGDAKHILLVGGGIGTAVLYPQVKHLFDAGRPADAVIGARTKSLVMYEADFRRYAREVYVTTDDGSYGEKGFVTDVVKRLLGEDGSFDLVFAVGPLGMMRAVCEVTRPFGVRTVVSMNSMMVDGTGMCGCCRLTVHGETKYACVDGPEFDGHGVDFDEAIARSKTYLEEESEQRCRLTGGTCRG